MHMLCNMYLFLSLLAVSLPRSGGSSGDSRITLQRVVTDSGVVRVAVPDLTCDPRQHGAVGYAIHGEYLSELCIDRWWIEGGVLGEGWGGVLCGVLCGVLLLHLRVAPYGLEQPATPHAYTCAGSTMRAAFNPHAMLTPVRHINTYINILLDNII